MEDVFKFLLVIGVIVFGIVRQYKKEAASKSGDGLPVPDADTPLPENWGGGTYGGYIPEGPRPQTADACAEATTQTQSLTSSTPPSPPKRVAEPSTRPSRPKDTPPATDTPPEYDLRSIEEVRRGIIWSEILRRKY